MQDSTVKRARCPVVPADLDLLARLRPVRTRGREGIPLGLVPVEGLPLHQEVVLRGGTRGTPGRRGRGGGQRGPEAAAAGLGRGWPRGRGRACVTALQRLARGS